MSEINEAYLGEPVLVIDDVPAARKILTRYLERMGFTNVHAVATGAEALDLLCSQEMLFVIVDFNLREMTAERILREIRSCPGFEQLPFLVVSSDLAPSELEEMRGLGVSVWLEKPMSIAQLQHGILEALGEGDV